METKKTSHLRLVQTSPRSITPKDRTYPGSLVIVATISGLIGFPGNQSMNQKFGYAPITRELLTSCIHNGESEGFVNHAEQGYTEIYCSQKKILHYIRATNTLLILSQNQE